MPYFAFFHKRVWRTSGKKFKKIKNFEWENCQISADFIWNDSYISFFTRESSYCFRRILVVAILSICPSVT